jgi:hypothetical protein
MGLHGEQGADPRPCFSSGAPSRLEEFGHFAVFTIDEEVEILRRFC